MLKQIKKRVQIFRIILNLQWEICNGAIVVGFITNAKDQGMCKKNEKNSIFTKEKLCGKFVAGKFGKRRTRKKKNVFVVEVFQSHNFAGYASSLRSVGPSTNFEMKLNY